MNSPNFRCFYECLIAIGPQTLTNFPDTLVKWLKLETTGTDILWRVGLEEEFLWMWKESPEQAVQHAYDEYIEAVEDALLQLPICDWDEGWVTSPEGEGLLTWYESILSICGVLSAAAVELLFAAACQGGTVGAVPGWRLDSNSISS